MLFKRKDPEDRDKGLPGQKMGLGEALGHAKDVVEEGFGPSPAERKLFKHGAEGEGVVTSHAMIARSQFGRETFYSIVVRFRSADGTEAEFNCPAVKRDKVGMLETGDKVPVRYDSADPAKATLDLPALEARFARHVEEVEGLRHQMDDEKVAKAEAEVDGRVWTPSDPEQQKSDLTTHRMDVRPGLAWTPIGDRLLPIEAAAKAGAGGVTVEGPIGELIKGPAHAAVSYVSQHAAELLPELADDWFSTHVIRIFQPYGGAPAGVTATHAESAGLAIVAALVSSLTGHLVRTEVALTGGLTAAGDLTPVPGLKKKRQVAERDWAKRLIAPTPAEQGGQAEPQQGQVQDQQGQGLEVVFIANVPDALQAALAKHRLKGYVPPV